MVLIKEMIIGLMVYSMKIFFGFVCTTALFIHLGKIGVLY